jgi:O-antigen/teichoic acid export membrane protein
MVNVSETSKSIIRESSAFALSIYLSQMICVVRGFIVAHFLGPSLFGIWSLLKSYVQCGNYAAFGVTWAVSRELPFNLGNNQAHKNLLLKQSALIFVIGVSVVVALGAWVFSLCDMAADYRLELRLAGAVFISNMVHLYIDQQLRGEKKTYLLAVYWLSYTVICTLVGLMLMFPFGISGLLAGLLIANIALTGYLCVKGHLSFKLAYDHAIVRKLIVVGFPIMLVESAPRLMGTLDKLVVFVMLDSTATGYYSMAAFLSETLNLIPAVLGAVLLPKLMYEKGRGVDLATLGYLYDKPIILLACFVPIILGLAMLNIDIVLRWLLPAYLPAVTALKILIMGLFFSVILSIPKGLMVVYGKHHVFLYVIPILLLIGMLMNIAVIAMGLGIMGVALASTGFYFAVELLINIYALNVMRRDREQIRSALISIHLPYIYVLVGAIIIDQQHFVQSALMEGVIGSTMFLLYCIPVVFWADRRLALFAHLHAAFFDKS